MEVLGKELELLKPLRNLNREIRSNQIIWSAEGHDPQFLLMNGENGAEFKCGWYLLKFKVFTESGKILSPGLYPDYGEGMSEESKIWLPEPDQDGVVSVLFCLERHATTVRFDPTVQDAIFWFESISLKPINRIFAFARMVLVVGAAYRRTGVSTLSCVTGAIREIRRDGFSKYRKNIYAGYRGTLGDGISDYTAWLRTLEHVASMDEAKERNAALTRNPLISILMPVYNAPEKWLVAAIESVIGQSYSNWELCIADDASPALHVRKVLSRYAAIDPRIKVEFREKNGHISASSNSALGLATGDFVALLDHDDELHPDALLCVVEYIDKHPDVMLLFTDEDKIDESGRRYDPYFKPDWNYDLFLGQNMVSHLGVYSASLVREIGGFREGFEGSQDWDIALRCVERIGSHQIGHLPKVLYHWRAIAGSTALGVGEKNYAAAAGARAVMEHLQRMNVKADVIVTANGHLKIRRSLAERPLVSLIIPTKDKVELLKVCVESILARSTYGNYEIVIVNNNSVESATFDYFEEKHFDPRVRIISYSFPFNYSSINNFAFSHCAGEVIGLINNDVEVITPDWLEELVSHAIRKDVGAVGAMLYYPDDTIQHAGVVLGVGGVANHIGVGLPRGAHGYMGRMALTQELSAVTAACLLVRRSVYEEVGGLDERLQVAFNDIDFCLRLQAAGYRNIWTPHAELYHHESASRGREDDEEKMKRFTSEVDFMRSKWTGQLSDDRCYNPNLSLEFTGMFQLSRHPRVSSRLIL